MNPVTVGDGLPFSKMEECITAFDKAHIFSTMDANGGYRQLEFNQAVREKTHFTSHHGLYQFITMPFGLKNAPARSN